MLENARRNAARQILARVWHPNDIASHKIMKEHPHVGGQKFRLFSREASRRESVYLVDNFDFRWLEAAQFVVKRAPHRERVFRRLDGPFTRGHRFNRDSAPLAHNLKFLLNPPAALATQTARRTCRRYARDNTPRTRRRDSCDGAASLAHRSARTRKSNRFSASVKRYHAAF